MNATQIDRALLNRRFLAWRSLFHFPAERNWLLISLVLFIGGLYKGINLLTLLAYVMSLVWLLNRYLAKRQVQRLKTRQYVEDFVFARTPFTLDVEVVNPTGEGRTALLLEDQGFRRGAKWFIDELPRNATQRFRHTVRLLERGWFSGPGLQISSGYPFGLVKYVESWNSELLVFPALGRLHRGRLRHFLTRASPAPGGVRQRLVRHPAAQSEFHGLRDYRSGDTPRHIHWRTSARRGVLMVREFEEDPSDHLILILDPWLPVAAENAVGQVGDIIRRSSSQEHLELAVSCAATICWEWCRRKGDRFVLALACRETPVVLDGLTGRAHLRRLLEGLALVQGTPSIDVTALTDSLASLRLPPAPILVLSTRDGDLRDHLERRLRRPIAALNVVDRNGYDFFEEVPDPPAVS